MNDGSDEKDNKKAVEQALEAYWLRKKEQVWLAISSANWLQQKL